MRVIDISRRGVSGAIGRKAEGLRWLARHGFETPRTYVIPWDAFSGDDEADAASMRRALATLVPDERTVWAVRSSANVEDSAEHSFAGQFESVLDVRGLDAVTDAVLAVRAHARSERVTSYLAQAGLDPGELKMAVIVQEMVVPRFAGVAFSVNPVTGLAETIVEAVEGSGEALVQGGVTPERWVRKWGAWTERPKGSALGESLAGQVADGAAQVAKRFGRPVDVEWVHDGSRLVFVQMREITTIDGVTYYSNRFAKEVLPGIIVPLVWSVNIPIVNGAWIRMLTEMVGETGLAPDDLARSFYYRAYFNMGALGRIFELVGLPRESLELLGGMEGGAERPRMRPGLRTLGKAPRALGFAAGKSRFSSYVAKALPELRDDLAAATAGPAPAALSADDTLARIDALRPVVTKAAYLNVVGPLTSSVMNRLFSRRLARAGLEFERVDFGIRDPGTEGRDPTAALDALHAAYRALPPPARSAVERGDEPALRAVAEASAFLGMLDEFLGRYGHFSDSGTDFSRPPWREDVPLVLRMIAAPRGESRTGAPERLDRTALARAGVGGGALRSFDRAARYQVLREEVSSFFTRSYGEYRPLYLRLGRELVASGALERAEDVFLLADGEVRSAISGALSAEEVRRRAEERAAEIEAVRDAVVPEVIFGDSPAPLVTPDGDTLSGVATSPGYHEGRAVVVTSTADIGKVESGDVLVVPYTDVAWTPLFATAGAVVAESGGFLSHSSIIAREYGIPAVVSVNGATRLVSSGSVVAVDGYAGTVTVLDEPERRPDSANEECGVA